MPTTRSASRQNSTTTTPATSPQDKSGGAGTKRKAEGTPSKAKRGKTEKDQKTLEETIDSGHHTKPKDIEMGEDKHESEPKEEEKRPEKNSQDQETSKNENVTKPDQKEKDDKYEKADKEMIEATKEAEKKTEEKEEKTDADKKEEGEKAEEKGATKDKEETEVKEADTKPETDDKTDTTESKDDNKASDGQGGSSSVPEGPAIKTVESRKKAEPSNILEKGLIYFFFRPRVNVEDPSSFGDIQRSYMLLRPLPAGAALGEGAVHSGGKARIVAVPKKTLPQSQRDRFLCFVESADASWDEIRRRHLARDEYTTRTAGDRASPAALPAAEGIYAITATGRESHLAYILTVPAELGDVQRDIGLASRGAFITSVRNPNTDAPPGTAPDRKANYSQEIMDDFRGLRWGRLEPRHLDYVDTHFLLIGEHEDGKLEKSVRAEDGDGTKQGKEEPREELELLEKEDAQRIKALSGDDSDAIFKDIGLSKDEYEKIKTSWE